MSRLLDDLCAAVRVRNYSTRTRKAYVGWVKRFVRFSGLRHPRELGKGDIERFIGYLATERDVAAWRADCAVAASEPPHHRQRPELPPVRRPSSFHRTQQIKAPCPN